MAPDIGIDAKTRKKVAGALEQVLADTYRSTPRRMAITGRSRDRASSRCTRCSKLSTMSFGSHST